MPTIYLCPVSDGTTTGWTATSGSLASNVDDYHAAGAENGAHDSDTTRVLSPTKTSSQAFLLLDDTPGDFDPANVTEIRIKQCSRRATSGVAGGIDTQDGSFQVVMADESTALTSVLTKTGLDDSYAGNETTEVVTQQGSPSKADWDGARMKLSNVYTQVDAADTNSFFVVTAVRVEIDYTDAPPPSDAPETLRVVTSNLRIR